MSRFPREPVHDAVGEVGHAGRLDHARALKPDLRAPEVVEQPGPVSKEDRDDVELHFVDQPCLEVLLSDVRATAQADVLIAGSFPGRLEGGSDSVGDEREAGASLLGNRLAGVVGDDEDRHVERRIVPPPASARR